MRAVEKAVHTLFINTVRGGLFYLFSVVANYGTDRFAETAFDLSVYLCVCVGGGELVEVAQLKAAPNVNKISRKLKK